MINLGSTIRSYRANKKMTQVQLAKKLDIEPTYLSAIETGKKDPSFGLIKKISKVFKTPIEIILWRSIRPDRDMSPKDRKLLNLANKLINSYMCD